MKLNPEELDVTSFETSQPEAAASDPVKTIIISPNDPTAATWCYICPQETYRCW
jgi:hypothetical protein